MWHPWRKYATTSRPVPHGREGSGICPRVLDARVRDGQGSASLESKHRIGLGRGTRAEACLPPLDRYDLQGQVDRTPIEVLGELGDDDDPVSEPIAAATG